MGKHRKAVVAIVVASSAALVGCGNEAEKIVSRLIGNPPPPPVAPPPPPARSVPMPPPMAISEMGQPSASGGRPLLFEVERNGETDWLFGTLHQGVSASSLDDRVWAGLNTATRLVVEADVANPDTAPQLAGLMALPPGGDLEKLLGPEHWDKTKQALGGTLSDDALRTLKPWAVSVTLTSRLLPRTSPMDVDLQKRAESEGDQLVFLETVPEQAAMLEAALGVSVLRDMVDRWEDQRTNADALRAAYLSGDAKQLESAVFDPEEVRRFPATYATLFDQRNVRWGPKIAGHLATDVTFVAVGAGHLVGPTGLIVQLEKQGFTVKQVEKKSGDGGAPAEGGE